ncbi:uncharacterized protein I303_106133 [Kwoniella dejecticola CBS 10117]|uniref:Peptidase M24 domain-containing protein n=1 Tax=Kwoniella dejecticola CBS 10117 TaxID=1296121 RepID=A0A1A6A1D5_9TREE|nr:uncharacterized protein I303_06152 [Kwoniella dejecticola CBS 10117]OBR83869.1 hypothetical protein I303_06152 [Kwoniella dejecticola CBS 10117]
MSVLVICTIQYLLQSHTRTSLFDLTQYTSYLTNNPNTYPTPELNPDFVSSCQRLLTPPPGTYTDRLEKLSAILPKGSMWISEPSPSAYYFLGGFSTDQWFLSERPFLIAISSSYFDSNITLLTPSFEALRAKLIVDSLPEEVRERIRWIEWREDQSPYQILKEGLKDKVKRADSGVDSNSTSFVLDDNTREFVARGLRGVMQENQQGLESEIRRIREKKNEWEIGLLRCANQFTLHAIRKTRERMYFGISESQTSQILKEEMAKTGLVGGEGLVLFGENAALPHGSGTDRVLTKEDLVLIDAGGKWGEYVSDITRTFALPGSKIPKSHIELWEIVRQAQKAPYELLLSQKYNESLTFGDLDKSARDVVSNWKNKQKDHVSAEQDRDQDQDQHSSNDIDFSIFTHRLGHGIGLEGHESPYVIQGAQGRNQIEEGNVFSLEPGIYLPSGGKKVNGLKGIGVRLEDCFALTKDREGRWNGEWLSGPVRYWGDI